MLSAVTGYDMSVNWLVARIRVTTHATGREAVDDDRLGDKEDGNNVAHDAPSAEVMDSVREESVEALSTA